MTIFSAMAFLCMWLTMGEGGSEQSACVGASCPAAPDAELSVLVQTKKMAAVRQHLADGGKAPSAEAAAEVPRITISGSKFMQGDAEVLPLGGNYAVKAQPYYPPVNIVTDDAKAMAAGAASSKYQPSDGRKIVPMVRLTTYFDGAMPNEAGVFDSAWQARLEATVKAFAAEGVYVLFDIHQDAIATTNGGAGLPWWMTAYMQETAGSAPHCPICSKRDSYITSPEHPLDFILPDFLQTALEDLGVSIPYVEVVNTTDPWLPYSVGGNAGDPRSMNVGNINMRANNNDAAWQRGTLLFTNQVQNVAWRFYRSYKYSKDKAAIFDHYMTFLRYLISVYEANTNVVAIELLNEPPFGGLPHVVAATNSRSDLFGFYAAVLTELDADPTPTKAPFVIEDVGGSSLPPALTRIAQLLNIDDIRDDDRKTLKKWSAKNQLIYEFHWYPGSMDEDSLQTYLKGAKLLAKKLGNPPIYLGEFWTGTASESARWLAEASEMGINAVTYWQYVNTTYTGTGGWFIYPEGVPDSFLDFTSASDVNWTAWNIYEQTVADGTYWGAYICGASGGHMGVLNELQPVSMSRSVKPTAHGVSGSESFPLQVSAGGGGSSRASGR